MKGACQRGFAMVLVLWAVALLMAIIPVFVHSMRAESSAVANAADSAGARALAMAGVEAAVAELAADFSFVASGGDGVALLERGSAPGPAPSERSFELGGGRVSYTIEDERAKININTAGREVIDSLLRASGVGDPERDVIADSILDWRDDNHEFHLNGAEDDYYAALPVPYGAKDGPADFREELLLVRGMTRAVFYGDGGDGSQRPAKGMGRLVTVHGDGRLNLNTASEEALEAFYGRGVASEILLRRRADGYISIPFSNGLVTSDIFTIESTGEHNGMRYRVEVTVKKTPGAGIRCLSWRDWGLQG